jgi:predicted component of type VI protein secretion system
MAFLIIYQKGREVGRWQLGGPTLIGRAADCQVSVHDILLSRHHCRVQPYRGGWEAIDLNSKNGTEVANGRITRHPLRDGDSLRMGRTVAQFQIGKLRDNSPGVLRLKKSRPADPHEALAGTVSGFDAEAVAELQRKKRFPSPRPIPPEPSAYAREDVYTMLTEIASSSWDSIYANASRPRRALPAAPPLAGRVTIVPAAPVRKRPPRPGMQWTLEAPAAGPARVARPARPAVVLHRSRASLWVGNFTGSVGFGLERVRRWVAPIGAIRLL